MIFILAAGCGGDGASNLNPSSNLDSENPLQPGNPSFPDSIPSSGSLKIQVKWPENSEITGSVLPSDVTELEITVRGPGIDVNKPIVEFIIRPDTEKRISGIPPGPKEVELRGLNSGGALLCHRKTNIIIIKNQTTVAENVHMGVSILVNGEFCPDTIHILPGDTLYWVNNDSMDHSVVSQNPSLFQSGNISPGGEFSCQFDTGGNYPYEGDTGKTGTVIVDIAPPQVGDFTPFGGIGGTEVTISGLYLNTEPSAVVKFNGISSTGFTVVSSTEIRAEVPSGATTGKISVETPGGAGISSSDFYVNIHRVSVSSEGIEGDGISQYSSISEDGRYVALSSDAANLVPGDTNISSDVFVYDRLTGEIERVSLSSEGTEGNDLSKMPSLSGEGRYVAFLSSATNLVPGDTNGHLDIFVHDIVSGMTERVSVSTGGLQANNYSFVPSISSDGRYVAFESRASNLVQGDTNGAWDIFVHDRVTGVTERVSVDSFGTEGNNQSYKPNISSDGGFVGFRSTASNLVIQDNNGVQDVFVHDRVTGQTERVSVNSGGTEGNGGSDNPSLSSDGRYVAFESYASNLVSGDTNVERDIFVHDRMTGQTERISVNSGGIEQNEDCVYPDISGDSRFVTFSSSATNLVSSDNNGTIDVFLHDRQTGETIRISIDSGGEEGNEISFHSFISDDGEQVVFKSDASNLVPGDNNGCRDIFVYLLSQ